MFKNANFAQNTLIGKSKDMETSVASQTMAMTVDDLARELHLGRSTAYNLANEPGFPSFRIGKKLLINRDGLKRWIDEKCGINTRPMGL